MAKSNFQRSRVDKTVSEAYTGSVIVVVYVKLVENQPDPNCNLDILYILPGVLIFTGSANLTGLYAEWLFIKRHGIQCGLFQGNILSWLLYFLIGFCKAFG
jgi:hypothetical protein